MRAKNLQTGGELPTWFCPDRYMGLSKFSFAQWNRELRKRLHISELLNQREVSSNAEVCDKKLQDHFSAFDNLEKGPFYFVNEMFAVSPSLLSGTAAIVHDMTVLEVLHLAHLVSLKIPLAASSFSAIKQGESSTPED
ncbi:MAG: DUF6387 family protein [Rudaea sp.]|uniref:DUF6387 family protein n=1 Tax=Rudaea sp. TaxID=2136325 RepID=UPI0039E3A659